MCQGPWSLIYEVTIEAPSSSDNAAYILPLSIIEVGVVLSEWA